MSNELSVSNIIKESGAYTSLVPKTEEESTIAFNALTNPDFKSDDMINQKFEIKNVMIQNVTMTDKDTGETIEVPRVILINPEGESVVFISKGILTAVSNLIMCFGQPQTWTSPKNVIFKQKKVALGTMLTFELSK